MVWNHRVVRRVFPIPEVMRKEYGETEIMLYIHEAHYDPVGDKLDGKVNGITEDAVCIMGEDVESLRWVLNKMLEALDKPVLDYDEICSSDEE